MRCGSSLACAPRAAAIASSLLLALLPQTLAAQAAGLPGDRVGDVAYGVYVPRLGAGEAAPPLVVVLHGCRQSAADMRSLTGFDALADEHRFAVAYAETHASVSNPLGCWTWWLPANLGRGHGLAADLVGLVARVHESLAVDTTRVYIAGFSSGAAMALVAALAYPDVFAAAGIHSGLPFGAAGAWTCAAEVMEAGDAGAAARARDIFAVQASRHRVLPVIVIQGGGDDVVNELNAAQIVEQVAAVNDLADDGRDNGSFPPLPPVDTAGPATADRDFLRTDYPDAAERTLLSLTSVSGMGHAWSGGPPGMPYSDPGGPDASARMWRFFSQWSLADPPIRETPAAACEERNASNFAHFWWHRDMSVDEYFCDPWTSSWRRSFGDGWYFGRCP